MSSDDVPRFRISSWPPVLRPPSHVAVPRVVAVCDFRWPDEGDEGLGLDDERFVRVGPKIGESRRPGDSTPLYETPDALLYVEAGFLERHPGCEDGLIHAAEQVDDPPVLLVSYDVDLVELPDELFLREFLELDHNDTAAVTRFATTWGPVLLPVGMFDDNIVQLVPRDWREYALEVDPGETFRAERLSGPAPENNLREFVEQGIQEALRRTRARRGEVSAAAALDPLDAVLGHPKRAMTEHRLALRDDLYLAPTVDEGEEQAFRLPDSGETIGVRGHSLPLQQMVLSLFQAVVESWVRLDPDTDLAFDHLGLPPPERVTQAWTSRELPEPTTTFELLGTLEQLLNETTTSLGPRIEFGHPALDPLGGAYGRPLPRILPAVALQLLEWVGEGIPARPCANEPCGQLFTRQRGRAQAGQYRTTGVMYCSSWCAKAQAQRDYRRRKRRG